MQRLPSTNPCRSQVVTTVEGKESLNRALQIDRMRKPPSVHTNWDETNSVMGESAGRGDTTMPLDLRQRREEWRGVERRKGHSAVSISSCYKLTYLVEGFGGIGMVPRVSALLTSSYWAVARPDQGHFFNICNLDQSSSTLFNITTSVFLCQDYRTTASISSTIPAQSRI